MRQYRFTSDQFVLPGETGETDAVMDAGDLARIKQLAGIPITEDYYEAGGHDPAITTPADNTNSSLMSPVGTNQGDRPNKRQIERDRGIKVGSDEWFRLWFEKPELTGTKPVGDAPAPEIPNPRIQSKEK